MVAAPIGARQRPAPIKRPPTPQQWTIDFLSLCVAHNALTSYVMCSAGNAPRSSLSLSLLFMSTFNRFCIGSALSLAVAGVACFAALMHNTTGPSTKGVLLPKLTQSERDLISNPSSGLLIFQTDNSPGFYYFDGVEWVNLSTGNGSTISVNSQDINNTLLYTQGF